MHFPSFVMFGHDIQHSFFSLNGPMNASMTHQPLKCDGGMYYIHFCNTADEWWQEQHMVLWSSSTTCGIHFAQTLCFPKLLVRIQ